MNFSGLFEFRVSFSNISRIIKKRYPIILIVFIAFCFNLYNYDFPLGRDNFGADFFIDFINGKDIGLMSLPYLSYNFMLFPFLLLFGAETIAIRIAQSFAIAFSVLLLYLFVRESYDEKTAIISALILSFMPFFVLMRWGETPFLPIYGLLIILLLYRFHKTSQIKYLLFSGLVIGAAIFFKLIPDLYEVNL